MRFFGRKIGFLVQKKLFCTVSIIRHNRVPDHSAGGIMSKSISAAHAKKMSPQGEDKDKIVNMTKKSAKTKKVGSTESIKEPDSPCAPSPGNSATLGGSDNLGNTEPENEKSPDEKSPKNENGQSKQLGNSKNPDAAGSTSTGGAVDSNVLAKSRASKRVTQRQGSKGNVESKSRPTSAQVPTDGHDAVVTTSGGTGPTPKNIKKANTKALNTTRFFHNRTRFLYFLAHFKGFFELFYHFFEFPIMKKSCYTRQGSKEKKDPSPPGSPDQQNCAATEENHWENGSKGSKRKTKNFHDQGGVNSGNTGTTTADENPYATDLPERPKSPSPDQYAEHDLSANDT